MSIESISMAVTFIFIYIFIVRIIPSNRIRRNRWLSFSGGLAVSYVFIYIFPSLHGYQQSIREYNDNLAMDIEIYFVGLIGLLVYCGLERVAVVMEKQNNKGKWVFFWIEVAFFALYTMMISYIFVHSAIEGIQALLYIIAIGGHFLTVAHDLWFESPRKYLKLGRYILSVSVIVGCLIGAIIELSLVVNSVIYSFLSGAMILNVLKNELPNEHESHFPTFAISVLLYTSVLLSFNYFFSW
ncbi:hypothetical protein [Bacillus sp. FJAT-45350]|uniref:hypothetical protein n=1 Tax=Bacillus sp. FJAT-45350 TaxID=2011014 RepID=UPI000BB714FB|nr:hypothetical protein [Bacillus sp. FJAT-45350]